MEESAFCTGSRCSSLVASMASAILRCHAVRPKTRTKSGSAHERLCQKRQDLAQRTLKMLRLNRPAERILGNRFADLDPLQEVFAALSCRRSSRVEKTVEARAHLSGTMSQALPV